MKTTVELPVPLIREARELVASEGTTLRIVIERGLRRAIADSKREKPFRLRDASIDGRGLNPEVQDASWQRIRELTYEERGG